MNINMLLHKKTPNNDLVDNIVVGNVKLRSR